MTEPVVKLKRQLTLFHAVAVTCGLVIGTGIYVAPNTALRGAGSGGLALVFWGLGGILATFGALCNAELGTTFPAAGEKYLYLEKMYGKTYGPFVGFMYLWMYLFMFRPGANAVKCLTFAKYVLEPTFSDCDHPHAAVILLAVLLACIVTAVNCRDVRWSARGQTFFTSVGVLTLAAIALTGIVRIAQGKGLPITMVCTDLDIGDVVLASYSAIFSYWGWNALNFLIEELKDPYKNLPRAIWISMAIITLLYVTVNVSYLSVLGEDGVLKSEAVAVTFSQRMFGVVSWIIPICIALNTIASVNAAALVGSRLCFAGARRGHLPDFLSLIHVKYLTPIPALMQQLLIVIIMVSTVDLLTLFNNVVFANNLFESLNIIGMLWLRYKQPELPRPIKVHILIPVVFLVVMVALSLVPLVTKTRDTVAGVSIILSTGIVYYLLFVTWKNKPHFYRRWIQRQTSRVQKLLYSVKEGNKF